MPSLQVNDYDMAFMERGEGAPLLLLHGVLVDYRLWNPQMDDFGARYRAIAPSFRRCWPEQWDGEGDGYTIEQQVGDIASFIETLDDGAVHLLGASRGGHVAFRVAQRFPHLIRTLVLVEPAGPFDESLEPQRPLSAPPLPLGTLFAAAVEHIRRGEIDEGLAPIIDMLSDQGGWRDLPENRKQILRDNARTLLGQVREPPRAPITRADAQSISAPTLLIVGELSPEPFHRTMEGLLTALRDVRFATIPGASHVSHWDNPGAFNREVLGFLEAHGSRQSATNDR